ncbi:MAG: hypothetical protein NTX59_08055 [Elusimicrobia bacterium]|nr:hypothetical protein [Elusimicrobiota bacterium]
MIEYRISNEQLWGILEGWDEYVPQKVHLIACGGTALTIQGIKASTKDVDFIVPVEEEYRALVQTLRKLGYKQATGTGWSRENGFVFDLFRGDRVYVTGLLEPPLKQENHTFIKSFKKISVGALNDYDLIITKMFRGTSVDIEDCLKLIEFRTGSFDLKKLKDRYAEHAKYDVNPERMMQNLEGLLLRLNLNSSVQNGFHWQDQGT